MNTRGALEAFVFVFLIAVLSCSSGTSTSGSDAGDVAGDSIADVGDDQGTDSEQDDQRRDPGVPLEEVWDEPEADEDTGPTCTPTIPATGFPDNSYATVSEDFDYVVEAGYRLHGIIRRPDPAQYPDLCFPAVIPVPGGVNPGRTEANGPEGVAIAEAGVVVVTYNSAGRVSERPGDILSEGEPDFNGFQDQDDLCEIVQYAMDLDYVLADNVGLKTQSFGIAMGAGCAGRYAGTIPIKYLVDGEGPPNSFVTCHEPYALVPAHEHSDKYEVVHGILDDHYSTSRDPAQANLDWWAEREAIELIGDFRGRYLRLQAQWDHAQPPSNEDEMDMFDLPGQDWWHNKHTTDIVNTAIDGGVPWVRVNLPGQGNTVNATYDYDNRPTFLPGELADQLWGARAVIEMAGME